MSARTNGLGPFKITTPSLDPQTAVVKELPEGLMQDTIKQSGEASTFRDRSLKIKRPSCDFEGCKKSLSLFDRSQKCRCEQTFCKNHRFYLDHKCKFDYKDAGRKSLEEGLNKEYKPRHWHDQSGNGCAS